MARKNFLERYAKSKGVKGGKKSKSIRFNEEILEAIEHNAATANVSVSTLVQDAIIELGLDKKLDLNRE